MIEIVEANTDELIKRAKRLFKAYADSLWFDLNFQHFNQELNTFPEQYSPPTGCLFLALSDTQPIGCVGLRHLEKGICEMKRLYVRPNFRGKNIGRKLSEAVIKAGKTMGYEWMRLDTLNTMEVANELYTSLGFVQIEPYRYNPIQGALYFELNLK